MNYTNNCFTAFAFTFNLSPSNIVFTVQSKIIDMAK